MEGTRGANANQLKAELRDIIEKIQKSIRPEYITIVLLIYLVLFVRDTIEKGLFNRSNRNGFRTKQLILLFNTFREEFNSTAFISLASTFIYSLSILAQCTTYQKRILLFNEMMRFSVVIRTRMENLTSAREIVYFLLPFTTLFFLLCLYVFVYFINEQFPETSSFEYAPKHLHL